MSKDFDYINFRAIFQPYIISFKSYKNSVSFPPKKLQHHANWKDIKKFLKRRHYYNINDTNHCRLVFKMSHLQNILGLSNTLHLWNSFTSGALFISQEVCFLSSHQPFNNEENVTQMTQFILLGKGNRKKRSCFKATSLWRRKYFFFISSIWW